MGPVAYISLCLLGCLILNPSLAGSSGSVLCHCSNQTLGSGKVVTSCPEGWMNYQTHCYGLLSDGLTWSQAEVECQSLHHKAHLASILNEAEGETVARYIIQRGQRSTVWIGLHNPQHNGRWKWADGSLYQHKAWAPGEPNNHGRNEYCVALVVRDGFNKWSDIRCSMQNAFLCKY